MKTLLFLGIAALGAWFAYKYWYLPYEAQLNANSGTNTNSSTMTNPAGKPFTPGQVAQSMGTQLNQAVAGLLNTQLSQGNTVGNYTNTNSAKPGQVIIKKLPTF